MSSIQHLSPVSELTEPSLEINRSMELSGTELTVVTKHQWYLPVKVILDFVAALILVVLTAPFTLAGILLIKLTSPGPAFYAQSRLGKDDRVFKVIKLRTMIHNAEAGTGAVWSQDGDPRITKIGRILRKTHIDEFPQLFNVLLGQMSLVGPRPERPEIANALAWEVEHFEQRTRVRPGITGLAQLRLPPDSDIDGVRRKLACDLYYIQKMSPFLDLQLFFFTGWLFAKVFLAGAWRRIDIPDSRMINGTVGEFFAEEIDIAPRSDSAHS